MDMTDEDIRRLALHTERLTEASHHLANLHAKRICDLEEDISVLKQQLMLLQQDMHALLLNLKSTYLQ